MIAPLPTYNSNDLEKIVQKYVPQQRQSTGNGINPRNMNVSLFTRKLLLLLLLGVAAFSLPQVVEAQTEVDYANVLRNQTLEYQGINSSPYRPQIINQPSNGTASWLGGGTTLGLIGDNTLLYTPSSPTFLGLDTLQIGYWKNGNFGPVFTKRLIYITVEPSIVIAEDDYAVTGIAQSILIDVLSNDEGNSEVLHIKDPVLLVNNGQAQVVNGQILYTPDPNFEGVAHLNYISCDELNTCDLATVSICVYDSNNPQNDTLYITTIKNQPEVLLLPVAGYDLVESPVHGTFNTEEEITKYVPNEDYVGQDEFVYERIIDNNAIRKTVIVTILDVNEPNSFAFDDYFYTTEGRSLLTNANVLTNDLDGQNLEGVVRTSGPYYGSGSIDNDGNLTYHPNDGFSGVDEITYKVWPNGYNGLPEEATIYIYVSNQAPSATTFQLTTAKNTPLVIGYGISVVYHGFNVTAAPTKGQVGFYESIDESFYGGLHHVEGERVLVYVPDWNQVGADEFEIEYCVSSNEETCVPVKIYITVTDVDVPSDHICYANDCVWAGDTNNDGVVNMKDLLPIGLCMGEVGTTRPDPNLTDWYGQFGEHWQSEAGQLNFELKYIDSDGNGVVSAVDTSSISQFYGRQHSLTPEPLEEVHPLPLLFGQKDTIPLLGPGAIIEIPILLGAENFPALDAYGFTFDIDFRAAADIIDLESVELEFKQNSWLSYNSPILNMTQNPAEGLIEAGVTRTSGIAASGYGAIGLVKFIVTEDNIDGYRLDDAEFSIRLNASSMMNSAGQSYSLAGDEFTFRLGSSNASDLGGVKPLVQNTELYDSQIKVFPNPTQSILNVALYSQLEADKLKVFNLTGQEVLQMDDLLTNQLQLDVAHLQNGMYFMQIHTTDGGVVHKKFEVSR